MRDMRPVQRRRGPASGVAKPLADAELLRFRQHCRAERDVAEAEAAVPKEDGLVVALAPGLEAADDLAELGVQRLAGELSGIDVLAERSERAGADLAPIVDDQLIHNVSE